MEQWISLITLAVAGYDLGGFGAMELLHKVPDRVIRIALISTNALADTPKKALRVKPTSPKRGRDAGIW